MWPPPTCTTISSVLRFFAVPQNLWDAFCQAIGDPGEDLRLVAALPAELVAESLAATRLPTGRRLSPVEAIQVGMVFRACHRLIHLQGGGGLDVWKDPNPWSDPTPSPTASTTPGPLTTTSSGERKLKFSQILDQGDDTEFVCDSENAKSEFYTKYINKMGGLPVDSEDPSIEQLCALQRRVQTLRQPPYVDFSIWVPYSKRYLRAAKYKSFIMQEDGTFLAKMTPGPSSFQHWQSSYRLLRTALLMLDLISLSNILAWESMMEKLTRQYPGAWHLIVAADDRARGEYMGRTLARIRMELDQGMAPPHGWDPNRPWDEVWKQVLADRDFWNEQVHLPAMVWTSRGARGIPLTPVEEFAADHIKGGTAALLPDMEKPDKEKSPNPKRASNRVRREAKKKRLAAEREELRQLRGGGKGGKSSGSHQGPKGGKSGGGSGELCYAWNNGNGLCGGLPPGEACKAKIPREHRCTRCGSPGHPSKDCQKKS